MNTQIIVTTSWDDGHLLDLRLADLLTKFGIKGTFYISPDNTEFKQTDLLSERDIIGLSKNYEIGAHTIHHVDLTKIPVARAEKEIRLSKQYLEKILNKAVYSFCYPRGKFNNDVIAIVKKSGYRVARTTERFKTTTGTDPYTLPTTIHLYDHWQDAANIPLLLSNISIRWDILAINTFDSVLVSGGVFHLWGHSWEIEKHHDWDRLENILAYISNRPNIRYVTNAELI